MKRKRKEIDFLLPFGPNFKSPVLRVLVLFSALFLFIANGYAQDKGKSAREALAEINLLLYNNPEEAIRKGKETYEKIEGDPSLQVKYLLTIANAYVVLKKHEKVFEYALKAEEIAMQNENIVDRIRVFGFLGGQYQRLNLKDKALNYADRAQETILKNPLPDSLKYLQANILFVKGVIQKEELDCNYALPYFEEAAEIFKKNTQKKVILVSLAITYNNIGDCYYENSLFEKAESSYREAIRCAALVNSKKSIAYARKGLGQIMAAKGNFKKALEYLNESLTLTDDINDMAARKDIYKSLSETYLMINDSENHQLYTKLYLEEEKKLVEEEKKSLNNVVNKISTDSKETQREQKNVYTFIIIFLCIILTAVLLFYLYKLSKKKKSIKKQKEIINESLNKD